MTENNKGMVVEIDGKLYCTLCNDEIAECELCNKPFLEGDTIYCDGKSIVKTHFCGVCSDSEKAIEEEDIYEDDEDDDNI